MYEKKKKLVHRDVEATRPEIGCKKTVKQGEVKLAKRRSTSLQDLASTLLDLLVTDPGITAASSEFAAGAVILAGTHPVLFFGRHNSIDCHCKNFVNTAHFLATAFDIGSVHSPGNCLTLFRRDRS
jgi:hypothetical protein